MPSIKNTTKFHLLNGAQQKGLKMQLNKLDLHNKLLLVLNKKIEKFPHNKVNDKMGGSLNQNIIFNFSNKNVNTDRRLINKQNLLNYKFSLKSDNTNLFGLTNIKGGKNAIKLLRSKVSDFGPVLVKTPSRLGVLNNVIKILTSFFNNLSCYISRPQFINKADKLIIKIFFYQNNSNKDALSNNNKLNFIYDLFNGKAAAKAQYNAPKSQNFAATEWYGKSLWWLELSNSGESLKLLVPNYIRKFISGWANPSCKVISQKISEKKMGYRGSKSIFQTNIVKEQRVDGSYCIRKFNYRPMQLRYTLMSFERNFRIKIPSKQVNKLTFSTLNSPLSSKMNPWFLTGFTDAEGSFTFSIIKNDRRKNSWEIQPSFSINLHAKDTAILEEIQYTLGIGKIYTHAENSVIFQVRSISELQVVLDHFDKYPLVTAKVSDYEIFKKCVQLIKQKEHLTEAGLLKIVGLKNILNRGLSENIQKAFPNFELIDRPSYVFKSIPDPYWVAGFTSGDGSFYFKVAKSSSHSLGAKIQLTYSITLHLRETEVLKGLAKYFNLNIIKELKTHEEIKYKYIYISDKAVQFQINSYSDIINIIIPFFEKYPIQGQKSFDFADFKKVAELMEKKEHLTSEGLNKILKIKSEHNQNRKGFWNEEN